MSNDDDDNNSNPTAQTTFKEMTIEETHAILMSGDPDALRKLKAYYDAKKQSKQPNPESHDGVRLHTPSNVYMGEQSKYCQAHNWVGVCDHTHTDDKIVTLNPADDIDFQLEQQALLASLQEN